MSRLAEESHINLIHICGHLFVFSHDVSMSHVDVGVKAVMERTISENQADRLVTNLKV